ncbi:hypothetical protein RQN30_06780 [Arcanobacterium hippocoleae]
MQTPTDPYNSASRPPFDDDAEVLAPIEIDENAANTQDFRSEADESLSYGSAEALAWEKVFTAESAAAAAAPDFVQPEAGETDGDSDSQQENAPAANRAAEMPAGQNELSQGGYPAKLENDSAPLFSESHEPRNYQENKVNQVNAETGFNVIPAGQRANANLGDVLSAHSADEARFDTSAAANNPNQESGNVNAGYQMFDGAPNAPAVSIAAPLGTETGQSPQAQTAGFMHPDVSADADAERRARWAQGPSAYVDEDEIDLEAPGSRIWAHVGIFS